MTIDEMAEKSHISRSSILRFAKKLSLKGYSELKVYLRMDVQREELPERDVLGEVCDDYHLLSMNFAQRIARIFAV